MIYICKIANAIFLFNYTYYDLSPTKFKGKNLYSPNLNAAKVSLHGGVQ